MHKTPANRPRTHVHTTRCVLELDAHQTAQQGTESNGYRGMGPGERVRSVNEQLSHHRVVSGQLHNAQTPANRPRTHVHTTRCVLELRRTLRRLSRRTESTTDIVAWGSGGAGQIGNEQLSHHEWCQDSFTMPNTGQPPRTHVHTTRCVLELDAPAAAGHRE